MVPRMPQSEIVAQFMSQYPVRDVRFPFEPDDHACHGPLGVLVAWTFDWRATDGWSRVGPYDEHVDSSVVGTESLRQRLGLIVVGDVGKSIRLRHGDEPECGGF